MSSTHIESLNSIAARWAEVMWAVSWQFCVLGLVVLLIHWLLRGAAPNWRYWLWQVLAIKLLLMPFWTATAPWKWPISNPHHEITAATPPPSAIPNAKPQSPPGTVAIVSSTDGSAKAAPREKALDSTSVPITRPAGPKKSPSLAANGSNSGPTRTRAKKTAMPAPRSNKAAVASVTSSPASRTTVLDQPSPKEPVVEEISEVATTSVSAPPAARSASAPAAASTPPAPALTRMTWLLFLWMGAVLTLGLRTIWQGLSLDRRLRKTVAGDPDLVERVRAAAAKLGMSRIPEVRIINVEISPFVCGMWRPRLIVPQGLAQSFTPEQLDLVLLHELAHIRRQDLIWGWIPEIAKVLFFFHPVVHFLGAQVRFERELACDQLAMVSSGRDAATYADTLVRVVGQFSGPDSFQLAANSATLVGPEQ